MHTRPLVGYLLCATATTLAGCASSPHVADTTGADASDVALATTDIVDTGARGDVNASDGGATDTGPSDLDAHDDGATDGPATGRDAADAATGVPRGDLPGWHQIMAEDFDTPVAIGAFPGTAYASDIHPYDDGTPDTDHVAVYMASRTLSVHDGMLDVYVHTEGGVHMCAAFIARPTGTAQTYGRYSVRYRADAVSRYGGVWMFWEDTNTPAWPRQGEIDFPEGEFASDAWAHMHHATAAGSQDSFDTHQTPANWHIATTEWLPGRVTFYWDGAVVGTSTTLTPTTPMHLVFQCGSAVGPIDGGDPLDGTASGHVQVDWITLYTMS